jgi:lysozyme
MGQGITGNVADKIAKLIAGHEGDKLTVYPDEGGLWTIGKGHLIRPGERFYPYGGKMIIPTDPLTGKPAPSGVRTITQAESDALFLRDTETARNAVANKVTVPLNDNQRAALVSLVFNIGAGAFATSTLLRKLNAGDYAAAADQFLVWKKVAGKDSAGLLKRRKDERSIFLA